MQTNVYDSIIPCFGSRLTVLTLPSAKQYRVHPLGTFHYFDWQKTDKVGISIGTCPQIVSTETALIGVTVDGVTRILPFADGECFRNLKQTVTPLTTQFVAQDETLGVRFVATFSSYFYPQDKQLSIVPGYRISISVNCDHDADIELFFALPLAEPTALTDSHTGAGLLSRGERKDGWQSSSPIVFPDGIDHAGIDGLTFDQVILSEGGIASAENGYAKLSYQHRATKGEGYQAEFFHAGYIAQPSLNVQGQTKRFAYTDYWADATEVATWLRKNRIANAIKTDFFDSAIYFSHNIPPALRQLHASAFKGLASNAWWAEDEWFSVMEIGAYQSTLDVDYQLSVFFFQFWPELIRPMLDQWAQFYSPNSGYMAHDVGQHLEATGNRYGGPGSAMKVEENCNYILLLHHYWRWTADHAVVNQHYPLIGELVDFLLASDTTGSGLPNKFCDNTNDWGSGLITASEEQSYHGVRMVAAFSAVAQMARHLGDEVQASRVEQQAQLIANTLESSWLGDHYPISLSSAESFQHYSMWTAHGLLYPLRSGLKMPLDLDKLRIDVINSTVRTMREHGCVHSTVDVRGWQTQNLWRDCIAAYLGIDYTHHLQRYLGHGEYVSYEDTTILEVANELMVVPGATKAHLAPGKTHDFPMVDGHPRPACVFGLMYAWAGVQFDAVDRVLRFNPTVFPLQVKLTHLADWENRRIPMVYCKRSIPNQDDGWKATEVVAELRHHLDLVEGFSAEISTPSPEPPTC